MVGNVGKYPHLGFDARLDVDSLAFAERAVDQPGVSLHGEFRPNFAGLALGRIAVDFCNPILVEK